VKYLLVAFIVVRERAPGDDAGDWPLSRSRTYMIPNPVIPEEIADDRRDDDDLAGARHDALPSHDEVVEYACGTLPGSERRKLARVD